MANFNLKYSGNVINSLLDFTNGVSNGIDAVSLNTFLTKIMNCKIKTGTKKCTTEHGFSTGIDLSEYSNPCIFASIISDTNETPTSPTTVFAYEGGTSGTVLCLEALSKTSMTVTISYAVMEAIE